MIIRLDEIHDEPLTWDCAEISFAESLDFPDLVEISEISWRGQVEKIPPNFRLTADLSYQQVVSCTRCLEPIKKRQETSIDLEIQVGLREFGGGEHELNATEMNVLLLSDEVLDTEMVLRDYLALNLPLKELCHEDCAGLCSVCGVNRNQVVCSCETELIDPRWSALKLLGSADN